MPVKALVRPTLRAIRWGGLAASVLPAAYLVWNVHNQPAPETAAIATSLRAAAIMIAAGLAFTLDDPTEDTTGCTPVSILARRVLRIALACTPALAFWIALRAYAVGAVPSGEALPPTPMLVEFGVFAGVAYAGAAFGGRILSDRLGGVAGSASVLAIAAVLAALPWDEGLLRRIPGTPPADAVALWWTALLVAAAAALWWFSVPPSMHFGLRAIRREVTAPGAVRIGIRLGPTSATGRSPTMGDKRVLSDDDINTTWRRAGGSAGLTADPDSTDSDGTDGDGAGGDGTDGDSDGTDTKDS